MFNTANFTTSILNPALSSVGCLRLRDSIFSNLHKGLGKRLGCYIHERYSEEPVYWEMHELCIHLPGTLFNISSTSWFFADGSGKEPIRKQQNYAIVIVGNYNIIKIIDQDKLATKLTRLKFRVFSK